MVKIVDIVFVDMVELVFNGHVGHWIKAHGSWITSLNSGHGLPCGHDSGHGCLYLHVNCSHRWRYDGNAQKYFWMENFVIKIGFDQKENGKNVFNKSLWQERILIEYIFRNIVEVCTHVKIFNLGRFIKL